MPLTGVIVGACAELYVIRCLDLIHRPLAAGACLARPLAPRVKPQMESMGYLRGSATCFVSLGQ